MIELTKQNGLTLCFVVVNLVLLYYIFAAVYVHLSLLILIVITYRYMRKHVSEFIDIRDKGVLITGCDTGLWGVVNNAAIKRILDIELVPIQQLKKQAEVNFYGMVRVTKAFIPMIRNSKGRIVNVTSVKGRIAVPHDVGYCVTKYAAEAFSDILRREMYKFGVNVSVIEPGYFHGATGLLDEKHKEYWETLPKETQALYGWNYVSTLVQRCRDGRAGGCYSPVPVMDAIVDALANIYPKCRYVVHGSKNWIDMLCLLPIMNEWLPERIVDWYMRRVVPTPKLTV